mgnify:CR=1 FL=1
MPYTLYNDTMEYYPIDYNAFYNTLISNPYLKTVSDYINKNIEILQELDKKQICNKAEYFKYDFNFAGADFHLHFNITNIIDSIKSSDLTVKKFSSKSFATIDSKILYHNELYSEYQAKCREPIILVPLEFSPSTKYIVIDGNHRLSYKLDMNYKTISCYIYNSAKASDFCFLYDFNLYKFYRELYKFLN